MKVQSVSLLNSILMSELSADSNDAYIEISNRKDITSSYLSNKLNFQDFISWINDLIDSKIREASQNFVHLTGDENIAGVKKFTNGISSISISATNISTDNLSATYVAELSAKHALWS